MTNRRSRVGHRYGAGPAQVGRRPIWIQTRTIALRLEALADTSVLVRIPVAREARNAPSGPMINKSGNRKLAVACEPMVSVLTEVAKLLQPGRCVT